MSSGAAVTTHILIIEGNISAGKSSLSRDLGAVLNYRVFLEPTSTNPYLEKFYADPKKYALPMQLYLLRKRFVTYISAVRHHLETGQGVILDRSVFSDCVFADKNVQDGNISAQGYEFYQKLRRQLLEGLPAPHLTLYLDVKPETCYDRVHNLRCRVRSVSAAGKMCYSHACAVQHADVGGARRAVQGCESTIPLEYLAGLDACYQQFLRMMDNAGSRVLVLDWSQFGSAEHVAQRVLREETESIHSAELLALVRDEAAVRARLRLPSGPRPEDVEDSDESEFDDSTDATVEESFGTPSKAAPSTPAAISPATVTELMAVTPGTPLGTPSKPLLRLESADRMTAAAVEAARVL